MMELVTAVITTYKRTPEMLKRALHSVLKQTYKPIEVIVVDDSPQSYEFKSQVRDVLVAYECVKYIAYENSPCGACYARNRGLQAAQGKYIAFLDDDDEWVPQKIELQIRKIELTNSALVYSPFWILNDKTGEKQISNVQPIEGMIFERLIANENFIGGASVPLMRTDSLRQINGFDETLPACQDIDVWLRIAKMFPVSYVKEPLVLYHIHPNEQITKNHAKRKKGVQIVNEKNNEYLSKHPKALSLRKLMLAREEAGEKNIIIALRLWFSSLVLNPTKVKRNMVYLYHILKNYFEK